MKKFFCGNLLRWSLVKSIIAISMGASLGATLRWGLGVLLNAAFPAIPLGTLTANLLGGYCMGIALGLFAFNPGIAYELRLFTITGFLGALTTFSTFSAEAIIFLQQRLLFRVACLVGLHVFGSLLMTFLGIMTFTMFRRYM